MRLLIDEYGSYLKKKGDRLVVVTDEKREEYPSGKLSQVLILKGSAISTDPIKLATEKNIDIACLDRLGRPYARVYPCRLGGTTLTRRNQLEAWGSAKGVALAKSFIRAKVENMGYFLKTLGKSRKRQELKEAGNVVLKLSPQIGELGGGRERARNQLLGVEGEGSKAYFAALRYVLPGELYHGSRTKRPPGDVFNALLSYGYGILYSEVEKACIISGLDPYLGFVHADRYGRPSLVLDLIEEFRQPIVDRAMVTLVARDQVGEGDVEGEKGTYLNKRGRKKAIEAVMSRLETRIKHRGKKIALEDVILRQSRDMAKFLNGDLRRYRPFIYRW